MCPDENYVAFKVRLRFLHLFFISVILVYGCDLNILERIVLWNATYKQIHRLNIIQGIF